MARDVPLSSQLLQEVNQQHSAYLHGDVKARENVVAAALKLVYELERPGDTLMRIAMAQPCQQAAIKTAVDLDVFRHFDENEPTTVTELAAATHCDPLLMARIMRTIAPIGFAREADEQSYLATGLTTAMADADFDAAYKFIFDAWMSSNLGTPDFLKSISYKNLSHPLDAPFQYVNNCKGEKNIFQMIDEKGMLPAFSSALKIGQKVRVHWSDEKKGFYPFTQRLVNCANSGDDVPFLVDIGSGDGSDLLNLLECHPRETLPGGLVLQELRNVLDGIPAGTLPTHIQLMEHNFYSPQPVKGARVYIMHAIMHDYPDDVCKQILKQIPSSMKRGYSKLLMWDFVVSDTGAGQIVAAFD